MNTTTDARQAAAARHEDDLRTGRAFDLVAASHRNADLLSYTPMITAAQFGKVVALLGNVAAVSPFYAYAVSNALPSVFHTLGAYQLSANIAASFGQTVRDGWTDYAALSGPEAGRPSQHRHGVTLAQSAGLRLVTVELGTILPLGSIPTPGWALVDVARAPEHYHALRDLLALLPSCSAAIDAANAEPGQ